MGNSISQTLNNPSPKTSHSLPNKSTKENDINPKGVDFTKILPTKILEKIILTYARKIDIEFSKEYDELPFDSIDKINNTRGLAFNEIYKSNNIMFNKLIINAFNQLTATSLACKNLRKICDNLNKPNKIYGQLSRYINIYIFWIKIQPTCSEANLTEAQFRGRIYREICQTQQIFLKSSVTKGIDIKIVLPFILNMKNRRIALDTLHHIIFLRYLDINMDKLEYIYPDKFWHDFTGFLLQKRAFHIFDSFNFDSSRIEIDEQDKKYLLDSLIHKPFKKMIFSYASINPENQNDIKTLTKNFPSSTISQKNMKVFLNNKNQMLNGVGERIERMDEINIALAPHLA